MEVRKYMKTTMITNDKRWQFVIEESDPPPKALTKGVMAIYHNDFASADVIHLIKEDVESLRNALNEFIELSHK